MDLKNKAIVIVGGSTGLGFSAAQACCEAGARVVIVGRSPDSLEHAQQTLGQNCLSHQGDASLPETSVAAIQSCLRTFGGFDGLYHVAGGSGRKWGDGPLHEITDEAWDQTLHWNLNSVFFSNRAAIRSFLDRSLPGSIVNMSSVLAFSPSPHHFASHAYAAAKSAIIGMSRASASKYAPNSIRINVIAPALVDTPMATRACKNESIQRFISSKQPLDGGRVGHPSDAASAVVYFLSDASNFVTGQVLSIDGGWQLSEGQV